MNEVNRIGRDRCGSYLTASYGVTVVYPQATGVVRRNMPDPIPVIVLARLAVDRRAQGDKLGVALLRDAVQRVVAVSENAGVRALLVHALNDRAKQFYEHYGFQASPAHPMTLMLRLQAVKSPD